MMNVIVVGCGRLGAKIANTLFRLGHTVSVIDKDNNAFNRLDDDFDGITVLGMPMDMSVLRDAGVENCDAVAVVTQDDNLNITVSQIVKEFFYIDNVIARINDPARKQVFYNLGLKTICPTNLSYGVFVSTITQKVMEKQINFGIHSIGINTKEVDPRMIGRALKNMPVKSTETIVGVSRASGDLLLYDGRQNIILNPKDKIIYGKVID
ncbi:MAG: TrkA family potassium uptake protein [Eubacteriales bacterium SKADARSKE-1]|nr:TrkA family potassium uptake protein [Eubacteriales bacterium SKADARSKE-1]